MPVYTYRVTVSYWIDVEAEDEATAFDEAMIHYEDGAYDGIEACDLMAVEEEEEEDNA